jgi:multisubunit Na+/H+ antiporter MnhG subunit
MNFDLRFPIGLLFTLFGLLLAGFGVVTKGDPDLYRRSLGINVNLWWGLFLLIFGLVMLFLARKGSK